MAPIWHVFTPPSYVPPFPEISDYSDAANRNSSNSRQPDFSEFKDPWEEYSPQNDPFSTDNSALNDKSEKCYCGIKYEEKANANHQNDHNATQLAYNQQFHFEQQHSSYTQKHDQHREHVTSYSEENRNQEHSVQHTAHHHWQQQNEQKHVEQHNEQWTEQRHHHVQHQHHEQRHNEQQHYNDQRQYNEHDQQFYQHDCHRNKADDHHHQHQSIQELQSVEMRHESHYHANGSNQASHQNADHLNHIVPHNESHAQLTINQDVQDQDNFSSHCCRCNEKNSEQALEAANKQTDTRRIDFLPPSPAPCTDLHNVATRSDPNVTEHLDNANVSNCSHIFFFSKFGSNITVRFRTYF